MTQTGRFVVLFSLSLLASDAVSSGAFVGRYI
jgi:hypothetical protein